MKYVDVSAKMLGMRNISLILLVVVLQAAVVNPARSCTTVLLGSKERPVFGRNYDYFFGDGMIVVNKRDMTKMALSFDNPIKWTSKFGSVSFTQYGREFPNGGMNEKGLTIAVLWLGRTKYETPDDRPSISPLQWVQYQLDTAASVKDIVDSQKRVRVKPIVGAMIHYFVADKSGKCAVIEFVDGKRVVYSGQNLPGAALANSTYKFSIGQLQQCKAFGGDLDAKDVTRSRRFVNAAARAKTYTAKSGNPVDYAFETLDRVAQAGFTRWRIVYDIAKGKIHLKTAAAEKLKTIDFSGLKFDSKSPVKVLDINSQLGGDVTQKLEDYSAKKNEDLIRLALKKSPTSRNTPDFLVRAVAAYPSTTVPAKK